MAWTLEQLTVGQSNPSAELIATLATEDKQKLAALLLMLGERGNLMTLPQSKALGQGLYELRTKTGVRVFYVFRPGQGSCCSAAS